MAKFGAIDHGHFLRGSLRHRPFCLRLAQVRLHHALFGRKAAAAQKCQVDVQAAQQLGRQRIDQAAGAAAQDAADDDGRHVGRKAQFERGVQPCRHHRQILHIAQQPRHLVGRGAAVQEDGAAGLDQFDAAVGDAPFFIQVELLARGKAQFQLPAAGNDRAAAHARQIALLFQLLQVLARGHFGDTQPVAQFNHRHLILLAQHLNDALAALFAGKHGTVAFFTVHTRHPLHQMAAIHRLHFVSPLFQWSAEILAPTSLQTHRHA